MNDNTKACVTFENTHKKFGSLVALDRLNLQIPRGSVYGFLGPNGAGKTTAMRILVGISKPTSGSVQVLDSNNIDDVRHLIGYLPEEKGLYKRMRVIDYIVYFGRLNGLVNAGNPALILLDGAGETRVERVGSFNRSRLQDALDSLS